MFNDDTCGVEDGGEGVDDVVVALMEEAGLDAGSLMDSFLVVEMSAIAAFGGSSDLSTLSPESAGAIAAFPSVSARLRAALNASERKLKAPHTHMTQH